jgi:hypothetical protein
MRSPWVLIAASLGSVSVALLAMQAGPLSAEQASPVTFHKDVLPLLQQHCQSCHRPGEIAPMSFLTYESTRPWARAIKTAVRTKKMPPWFADSQHGRFSNDRSLKQEEIDTLVKWADGGAAMGDPADAPPPKQWPEGWQIKPDYIVELPPYTVPADGTIEWAFLMIPSGFTEDTWVTSIEIRPSDRRAVHHAVAYIKPHSDDVPHNQFFWDQKQRDSKGRGVTIGSKAFTSTERVNAAGETVSADVFGGRNAGIYVPGVPPQNFGAHDAGQLIPANSDLTFNLHYQATGKPVTEVTRIGFTLAKQPPKRRFLTLAAQPPSIADPKVFRIPAGEPNWASPPVEMTVNVDAELAWMMPHMHFRGKDMTYRLTYPDGRTEIALHVPRYDFDWQIGYDTLTPLKLPKGTKVRVDAHFDNSPAKRGNPDATVDVFGGTQTWEEMMNPWFGILIDPRANPDAVMTTSAVAGGG